MARPTKAMQQAWDASTPEGWRKLIEGWHADLKRRRMSETGWYNYAVTARQFQRWANAQDASALTAENVLDWLSERSQQGVAGKTLNNQTMILRSLSRYALSRKLIAEDPTEDVELAATVDSDSGSRALSPTEIGRLIHLASMPNPYDRRYTTSRAHAYRLLATTGLRRREAKYLTWGEVKLDDGMPRLELKASRTKARKMQTLPLSPEAAAVFRQIRSELPKPARAEDRVLPSFPELITLKTDCDRAGIDRQDVGFHSFRKAWISYAAQHMSPAQLRTVARHSDLRTTQRSYIDPTLIDTEGALREMPGILAVGGSSGGGAPVAAPDISCVGTGLNPSLPIYSGTGTDSGFVIAQQGRNGTHPESQPEQQPPLTGGEPSGFRTLRQGFEPQFLG